MQADPPVGPRNVSVLLRTTDDKKQKLVLKEKFVDIYEAFFKV